MFLQAAFYQRISLTRQVMPGRELRARKQLNIQKKKLGTRDFSFPSLCFMTYIASKRKRKKKLHSGLLHHIFGEPAFGKWVERCHLMQRAGNFFVSLLFYFALKRTSQGEAMQDGIYYDKCSGLLIDLYVLAVLLTFF